MRSGYAEVVIYQNFVAEGEVLIRQSILNVIKNIHGPYALCGEV